MSKELRNYLIAKLERLANRMQNDGIKISKVWGKLNALDNKQLIEIYSGVFG